MQRTLPHKPWMRAQQGRLLFPPAHARCRCVTVA